MPALRIEVRGVVQGVGFRPFVYNEARECHLSGYVLNDTNGVEIEAQGTRENLERFLRHLKGKPPPQARIETVTAREVPEKAYSEFTIKESVAGDRRTVLTSPDLATCADCVRELFDPHDRRFKYPFLNCTNCGPRLTIIKGVPYDRARTTMAVFRMCPECRQEYGDPRNRRFHAQPNACPRCGPRLRLLDGSGDGSLGGEPIARTRELLRKGRIVAIKGIGGFHLACDAASDEAVGKLRRRKYREDKPFALMAPDVDSVRQFCEVNAAELALLESVQRPIVLLRKKPGGSISWKVAPLQKHWGVMLPYAPVHHLLLHDHDVVLVLTSGNRSDEPIAFRDQDAFERLRKIADCFLVHDREIHRRCDDSVTRVVGGSEMLVRRARGYVPRPIKMKGPFRGQILAVGAQLKNTFCLGRDDLAFVSSHIGDLENLETLQSFTEEIERFKRLCAVNPACVAYDLHPGYLSTKYALGLEGLVKVPVQHHQAHIASCMADNGVHGPLIGVAFDGTGYGEDGAIWGGEFFVGDRRRFERVAHLEYLPMPTGEAAIRHPWHMTLSYLFRCFGEGLWDLDLAFLRQLDRRKGEAITRMMTRNVGVFQTSSMGRLFDAVSVLLEWRDRTNYEGQPAIELESWADEKEQGFYPFEIGGQESSLTICVAGIVRCVVEDLLGGVGKETVSGKFHNTISRVIAETCGRIREHSGLKEVCLSGGVFQNALLLARSVELLAGNGFAVVTHHQVPPNDGGVSLGQAVMANERM